MDRAGYSGRGFLRKIVVHQWIASLLLDKLTGIKHPRNPAPHSCIAPAVCISRWARCGWLTAWRGCQARRGPGWKSAPGLVGPKINPVFIANNYLFTVVIGSFGLKTSRKGAKGWRSAGSCAWYGDKGAGQSRCATAETSTNRPGASVAAKTTRCGQWAGLSPTHLHQIELNWSRSAMLLRMT